MVLACLWQVVAILVWCLYNVQNFQDNIQSKLFRHLPTNLKACGPSPARSVSWKWWCLTWWLPLTLPSNEWPVWVHPDAKQPPNQQPEKDLESWAKLHPWPQATCCTSWCIISSWGMATWMKFGSGSASWNLFQPLLLLQRQVTHFIRLTERAKDLNQSS